MEEGTIQFVANYGDWRAVKKLKVDQTVDARMIMEFLASLGTSLDRKVEENLRKLVALDKVDALLKEELEKVKGEEGISKALNTVKGVKMSRILKEITDLPELQKGEKKELADFCRVYAMKKALSDLGLMVDYTKIEIPGMKKAKKKGKK